MNRLLGPRSTERPGDGGATAVSVLDSPLSFAVDGGGLVQGPDSAWCLDWWVGADDRWYLPAREPTVRQRLVGIGPVVETAVRVPSGDVIQTVYATLVAGRQVCVIEVTNRSPVPVALAVALRPFHLDGSAGRCQPHWASPTELVVDGLRLLLPRPPNEQALSSAQDLVAEVENGRDLAWSEPGSVSEDGPANALVMFPLPHSTTLRYCLAPSDVAVAPSRLADAESVARGWTTMVERRARFDYPDSGLTALVGTARARLLQIDDGIVDRLGLQAAEVLVAVAESGQTESVTRLLPLLLDRLATVARRRGRADDDAMATWIEYGARVAVMASDPVLGTDVLEVLSPMTRSLEPRRRFGRWDLSSDTSGPEMPWRRAALGLLPLVQWLGQDEATGELQRRISAVDPAPTGTRRGLSVHDRLVAWSQRPDLTRRWFTPTRSTPSSPSKSPSPSDDGLIDAARFLRTARELAVKERPTAARPTIELLPEYPTAWRGGSLEVHQAPTLYGPVSFAIRWHGARPALLWEQPDDSVRLECPGLDPEWSTTDQRGETLLAGSSGGLVDVPGPGDSFI